MAFIARLLNYEILPKGCRAKARHYKSRSLKMIVASDDVFFFNDARRVTPRRRLPIILFAFCLWDPSRQGLHQVAAQSVEIGLVHVAEFREPAVCFLAIEKFQTVLRGDVA